MFDELDDPAFAGAGTGAREAVAARATAIRRRRRAAWAGGGTSLALVLATIVYATGGGSPRSLDIVDEVASPTASATASEPVESPEPAPEPTGSASVSPSPAGVAASSPAPEEPRPEPQPTVSEEAYDAWKKPDGKPGWGGGYSGCGQLTEVPPAGKAPFPELRMELRIPAALESGKTHQARLLLTNTGDRYLRFSVYHERSTAVLRDARGHTNGSYWGDAVLTKHIEVAPGATVERDVTVTTWVCGDTPDDPNTPLPAGRYTVVAGLNWSSPATGTSPGPAADPTPEPTGDPGIPTPRPSEEPSPEPSPSVSWGQPDHGAGGWWAAPAATVTLTE